jgi:hypothetical protein
MDRAGVLKRSKAEQYYDELRGELEEHYHRLRQGDPAYQSFYRSFTEPKGRPI